MMVRIAAAIAALLALLVLGVWLYFGQFANPRTIRELIEQPDGERAQKVMLLTLPSRRVIPVNYLREGEMVYAGSDGGWWRELAGSGQPVVLFIRGETLIGTGRAVRDDPDYTAEVFSRLRPNALEGFGTLVEFRVGGPAASPAGP